MRKGNRQHDAHPSADATLPARRRAACLPLGLAHQGLRRAGPRGGRGRPRWRAEGADTEENVVRAGPGVRVHETAARVSGVQLRRRLVNELLTAAAAYRTGRECGKVDVIIGTVPSLPTLPVVIALALRTRTPAVAEIRDAWPDLLGEWEQWGDTGTAAVGRGPGNWCAA